jgi:hypothetical protein
MSVYTELTYLLHLLNDPQVSEHVPNRNNVPSLLEDFRDALGAVDGLLVRLASRDRLLDEHGDVGEVLKKLEFEVLGRSEATSEKRGGTDDDSAERAKGEVRGWKNEDRRSKEERNRG